MRTASLILVVTVGGLGLSACSGRRLHAGDDGAGGGHAGTGGTPAGGAGQAGAAAGAAGSTPPSGTAGATSAGGTTGANGGSAGAIGAGGAAGQVGAAELSVGPSSATFAGTLVEGVSASQTFTVRNTGNAAAALAAAFEGTNAADYQIVSNGCGSTLQPAASCDIAVAFAPQTRSGSRSASLAVSASAGVAARVSLTGAALPSLGLLAGAPGGPGSMDGIGGAARFSGPAGIAGDGAGNLYVADAGNDVIRKVVVATGAVTTLAGMAGQAGSADGTGAAASFWQPSGIIADGAGNLYVADNANYTIRKIVIATGAVTTLAGAPGQPGSLNGRGAAARFNYPTDIASDGAGNLYVADFNNDTIRQVVIATGTVTTLAGAAGQDGSADGTGTAARFMNPSHIASDGTGALYVTDSGNSTIRKIIIATRAVTTLAGAAGQTGVADGTAASARFAQPTDIAADGAGNLYVADSNNDTIRKVVIATGAVTTLAGAPGQIGVADGTGAAARFNLPNGVELDGAGNLYVSDGQNSTIRKVVIATGVVTTLAGAPGQVRNTTSGADSLHAPQAVVADGAGNLYVTDGNVIRKVVVATGAVTTLAGGSTSTSGADGIGAAANFFDLGGITSDGGGNLYVADSGNNTIRKIVIATGAVTTLAGTAGQNGGTDGIGAAARFSSPTGIVSDGAGNLYVAELSNCTVRRIVIATGAVTTLAGTAGARAMGGDGIGASARFTEPSAIASDGAGNLYVSDAGDNGTIRKIVIATAAVTTLAGTPGQHGTADGTGPDARFVAPWGIVSDGAGNLYVCDGTGVRKIVVATGAVTTIVGTPGQAGYADGTGAAARFNAPFGIAIDGAGTLYAADPGNDAIRKIVIGTGVVTTVGGAPEGTSVDGTGANARFTRPSGIAADGAGNVYVTDGNNTIRKIAIATRAVTTLAGAQGQHANVDGTGLSARFTSPYGITGDGGSNLYIVDVGAIRKIALTTGAVTTIAGSPNATLALAPFTGPTGIVSDGANTLYVSDAIAIRSIAVATGIVTTLAAFPSRSPEDMLPIGLANDGAGNLYYPDFGGIRKVAIATGLVTTVAGGSSNGSMDGPGPTASFNFPTGVASDGAGNIYVADTNNRTIRKIDVATSNVTTVIGSTSRAGVSLGALPASLNYPYGVAVLPTGEIAIVDSAEGVVLIGHL